MAGQREHVNVFMMDENGEPYGVEGISNKLRVSSVPYTYDIAEGNVPDHVGIHVLGHNLSVGNTFETLGHQGGVLTYLASAEQLKVSSSDTDDDGSPVGDGARTLRLTGLDSAYAVQTETITLNGTGVVTTTASFLRIYGARVLTAGSSMVNEGVISIKNSAETATLLQVALGEGEARGGIFTVPADQTLFIAHLFGSEASSKGSELHLFTRPENAAFFTRFNMSLFDSVFDHVLTMPLSVAAKTDVEYRAVSVMQAADVTAGFGGWYES